MKQTKRDSSHFWMNVATFEGLEKAQALCHCLEMAGFEARIQDERRLQRYWFFSGQHCGIHVRIPTESLEMAKEFLEANPEAKRWMDDAIHCPSCGSARVQYPQMTRKFILPTLIAHLLVLIRVMERECYCEDCHNTWPMPSRDRSVTHAKPRSKAVASKF